MNSRLDEKCKQTANVQALCREKSLEFPLSPGAYKTTHTLLRSMLCPQPLYKERSSQIFYVPLSKGASLEFFQVLAHIERRLQNFSKSQSLYRGDGSLRLFQVPETIKRGELSPRVYIERRIWNFFKSKRSI